MSDTAYVPTCTESAAVGGPEVRETTVLIIDDHQCFSDLLAAALATVDGIRCVGTASSAAEGLRRVQELTPSVAVVDISMPGTDGLVATRRLRQASPRTAVAVVTAHQDGEWVARAAQAGAAAFIPKSGSLGEMIDMLKAAKPGRMAVAASVLRTAEVRRDAMKVPCGLTGRELEVLGFIGQGLPVKSIARVLGISSHTCRGYIKTIYSKMHVNSRIGAVNRGRDLRLINA